MIQVVCFKWNKFGYRSTFGPDQVNTLKSMVKRNLKLKHEFVCITDDPEGLHHDVRHVPLWDDYSNLRNPHGDQFPSCYRRLKLFDKEFANSIGLTRFIWLDLDICIVDDITPLIDVPDDFKIWGDTARGTPYNGSMVLMKAGARQKVWDKFDPVKSPEKATSLGYIGSDQAWIGACLGPNEAKWTKEDGIYSYRNEVAPRGNTTMPPPGARIIIFHGHADPWMPSVWHQHPWVKEHWR